MPSGRPAKNDAVNRAVEMVSNGADPRTAWAACEKPNCLRRRRRSGALASLRVEHVIVMRDARWGAMLACLLALLPTTSHGQTAMMAVDM